MIDEQTPKRRGGRPRKPEAERRQITTLRLTGKLKEQLTLEAEGSGRSLSQEIESRLFQSLRQDELDRQARDNVIETVYAGLHGAVGGRRQFNQLMTLGQQLEFWAIDIAAQLPADDDERFRTALIQVPTANDLDSDRGVGNFTIFPIYITKSDQPALYESLKKSQKKFHRSKES